MAPLGPTVLFVLAISVLLIYVVDRGQVSAPRAEPETLPTRLPEPAADEQLTDRRTA